ncbi:MAG: hypothetical protein EOP59_00880 [Sphingomonadales bacterium]|nr:MAG: hypothetical protein EOP59_00880 [Sphingomonadales bacterium]
MLDILLAASIAFAPQTSTTWQLIDINRELSRVLTVDIATKPAAPKPDAIVKARIFVTMDNPEISALTGYWTIDCGKNLHRVSETAIYDKAGKLGPADPEPLPWEATSSGTLFQAVADYVCGGKTLYPGKVVTGSAPIAAANALLKPS